MADTKFEEIITYLETHDVGDGAMISTFSHVEGEIQTCFLCRCRNTRYHGTIKGKTFPGKIWEFNERLFKAGWEQVARFGRNHFTWTKKMSTGFLEAEC